MQNKSVSEVLIVSYMLQYLRFIVEQALKWPDRWGGDNCRCPSMLSLSDRSLSLEFIPFVFIESLFTILDFSGFQNCNPLMLYLMSCVVRYVDVL